MKDWQEDLKTNRVDRKDMSVRMNNIVNIAKEISALNHHENDLITHTAQSLIALKEKHKFLYSDKIIKILVVIISIIRCQRDFGKKVLKKICELEKNNN